MSAFKDISGQRFGKLVALTHRREGKRTIWTMRCDCGATEDVRAESLTRTDRPAIDRCRACRMVPCAICGTPFQRRGSGTTCGAPECVTALKVKNDALYTQRHQREVRAAARARYATVKADPERMTHRLSLQAERRREIPAEERRRAAAEYYARNRSEVSARLQERMNAMTPDEREEHLTRRRELVARSKAKARLSEAPRLGEALASKLKDSSDE